MAIQFFCSSCSKPIEIDDDAANQPVTCPYCQTLVTAPATSDPAFQSSAVVQPPLPGDAIAPPPLPPQALQKGNKLSWAALICVILAGCGYLALTMIALSVVAKSPGPVSPERFNKLLTEELKQRPALAAPFIASGAAACVLPIVGLVLSIIALARRRPPLWPAVTALCLVSVALILACGNLLLFRPPSAP